MGLKKFYIGALASVAAFTLVACSDSATPVEGTKDKSDTTLEEVFNKAMERLENLESFKAEWVMEQETTMIEDGEKVNMTSTTNLDMSTTQNPIAVYFEGEMAMSMADGTDSLEIPLKMYFTEADGFYMYDSEYWLKLPNESYEEMIGQTGGAGVDASEQLKPLKPYLSDFTFNQDDNTYILTLNAKGEKFNDLMLEQLEGSLDLESVSEDGLESVEDIEFENAKYVITIDKNTFDIKKIVMDFVVNMNIGGTETKVSAVSTANYSDINTTAAITIPKEVIENAIESEF